MSAIPGWTKYRRRNILAIDKFIAGRYPINQARAEEKYPYKKVYRRPNTLPINEPAVQRLTTRSGQTRVLKRVESAVKSSTQHSKPFTEESSQSRCQTPRAECSLIGLRFRAATSVRYVVPPMNKESSPSCWAWTWLGCGVVHDIFERRVTRHDHVPCHYLLSQLIMHCI